MSAFSRSVLINQDLPSETSPSALGSVHKVLQLFSEAFSKFLSLDWAVLFIYLFFL